ncbi:MAG: hypothetical protein GWO24_07760, partial [Akkermansiaceae bacterium]|nr:hypothetical protein [Akkermansiaceae bacterium]
MKAGKLVALLLAAVVCLPSEAPAAAPGPGVELGAPFRDHAILQRGMKVPVWGWSRPGTRVTVEFAGQEKNATTDRNGKWMLELDPLAASREPAEMTITVEGGGSVALEDLLVGEVWLASGQSNMQWIASKCDVGRVLMKRIEERVAAGEEKPPLIREALVTDCFAALHPIERTESRWSPAEGDSSA